MTPTLTSVALWGAFAGVLIGAFITWARWYVGRTDIAPLFEPMNPTPKPACHKAPKGWICTRGAGHDGPCAALPMYKAGELPGGMAHVPDNEEDSCIEAQVKDLLEGYGASEDHEDFVAALRKTFTETTAREIHRRVMTHPDAPNMAHLKDDWK